MPGSNRNPVAFVTGASSGIGKATARAFVATGYAVALVDVNEASGREVADELGQSGECRFFRCDISDDQQVAQAVAQAVTELGPFCAVFNAAGIDGEHGKATAETSIENWNRVIAVTLTGTWHCLRHQIPVMLENGGGSIVNCASVAGLVGAQCIPPYVAAKHGVVGITRAAALEYARSGIRVNAVCPGMIDTPMSRQSLDEPTLAVLLEQSAIGRLGQPEEVASAVLWLCDSSASFVTGQAIPVDGAWTTA